MSAIATAIVGAAVVGGVASSVASSNAASAQSSADQSAQNQQMQMFNTIQGNEQPYMTAGGNATTGLSQLLGLTSGTSETGGLANGYLTQTTAPFSFNPSSITSSPGYQFSQTQGLQQTQNAIAPNVAGHDELRDGQRGAVLQQLLRSGRDHIQHESQRPADAAEQHLQSPVIDRRAGPERSGRDRERWCATRHRCSSSDGSGWRGNRGGHHRRGQLDQRYRIERGKWIFAQQHFGQQHRYRHSSGR
jgi:hypothetical protein